MKSTVLAIAAVFAASPAAASTINIFAYAEYGIEAGPLGSSSDSPIADTTVDTTSGPVDHGETVAASDNIPPFYYEDNVDWSQGASASARVQASANAATGALNLESSQFTGLLGSGSVPPVSQASAYTFTEGKVSLSETFTVSGSGILLAFLDINSAVDLTRSLQGWSDFGASSTLSVASGGSTLANRSETIDHGDCADQDGDAACDSLASNVHQTSKVSVAISGLSEITITAAISAGDYAQGYTSLWAYLALLPTGNLKLTPVDDRFLSTPAYRPTAIPAPAGLSLLASGLALLPWVARRRKLRK